MSDRRKGCSWVLPDQKTGVLEQVTFCCDCGSAAPPYIQAVSSYLPGGDKLSRIVVGIRCPAPGCRRGVRQILVEVKSINFQENMAALSRLGPCQRCGVAPRALLSLQEVASYEELHGSGKHLDLLERRVVFQTVCYSCGNYLPDVVLLGSRDTSKVWQRTVESSSNKVQRNIRASVQKLHSP